MGIIDFLAKRLNLREDYDISPGELAEVTCGEARDSLCSSSASSGKCLVHVKDAESRIPELTQQLNDNDIVGQSARQSWVIDKAIEEMGLGRYQIILFLLTGLGWFMDNALLQVPALALTEVAKEFGLSQLRVRYTNDAISVGMGVGAFFWGWIMDRYGRRVPYVYTLLLGGSLCIGTAFAPNWISFCSLLAMAAFAIGGNLPVDGTMFMDFLPADKSALQIFLAGCWSLGSVESSFAGVGLLGVNARGMMGWRYLVLSMGCLCLGFWFIRTFLFYALESPKFLVSRGRTAEAVDVVSKLARFNGTTTWLTQDVLDAVAFSEKDSDKRPREPEPSQNWTRKISANTVQQLRILFSRGEMRLNTSLLFTNWTAIGMAYPLFNAFLPQYIAHAVSGGAGSMSPSRAAQNNGITSVVGFAGLPLGYWAIRHKHVGRCRTLGASTIVTGVFVFLFTSTLNVNVQLAHLCLAALFENIMYGTLYVYTLEAIPTPARGWGFGSASLLNRVASVCAPIIAANISEAMANVPIYVAGGLFILAGLVFFFLPIETRDRRRL